MRDLMWSFYEFISNLETVNFLTPTPDFICGKINAQSKL